MEHPEIDRLIDRLPVLADCREEIGRACGTLLDTFAAGGKLLLCGNGGSAADCEHWAGELLKGFIDQRPVSGDLRRNLPRHLAENLQQGLPAIPLTGFPSLATAFANDVDPQLTFAQLTLALGTKADAWVGISTSGNADNVRAAAQVARAAGLRTLALTGRSGGKLAPLVDTCIRAPADQTHLVQELHLPIYHTLCIVIEQEHFGRP